MKKVPKSYDFGTNGVPGRSRTVDVQLRRLTLYPTEVRGLIHDLDKYTEYMRDLGTNDLMLRRQILYPTEVRRLNEIIWKCTAITRLDARCVSTGSEYVMQQHKGSINHPENHMIDLSI